MLHSEEPRRPIELSESLNDKTFIEEREQDEFMATLKDQFFEDNTLAMKGASDIGKIMKDKLNHTLTQSLYTMKGDKDQLQYREEKEKDHFEIKKPNVTQKQMKSTLFALYMMLKIRVKEQVGIGFHKMSR